MNPAARSGWPPASTSRFAASPKLAIAVRGWFSSCTISDTISLMAESRATWLSSCCSLLTRACAATRSEMSRMKPVKMWLSPLFTSPTASSIGKVRPLLCRAMTVRPMPMIRFSPVVRYRCEIAVVLGPVGLGHQHGDVLADDFLGPVAEQPLGGRAEAADLAISPRS